MRVTPFAALRPAPGRVADVIAPPYDVVSSDEARAHAAGKPWSFLHVSRPEIDLPAGSSPRGAEAYAKAAENFRRMIDHGVLIRDPSPGYYCYRVSARGHTQTGIVATVSVADYEADRVRRHERTTPEKEEERARHMEALNAQIGPVMAAYPFAPAIDDCIATATATVPIAKAAEGGSRHTLWVLRDPALVRQLTTAFEALPAIYIADGHHRSAAVRRLSRARRVAGRIPGEDAGRARLLIAVFPARELRILDYNRLITTLGGRTAASLLACARERFLVEASAAPVRPTRPGQFGLFVDGRWHRLTIRPEFARSEDLVARLDVRLLSDHLLGPATGIIDDGRDERLTCVPGGRGLEELERRVQSGEMAAAVTLHPTRFSDVQAVADAGVVMPPKSTWFDPKLADGLVSHILNDAPPRRTLGSTARSAGDDETCLV